MPKKNEYKSDAKPESIRKRKQNGTSKAKKERVARNTARRRAKASGKNVDGKDIDHKNGNALDNRPSNLRVMSRSKNRSRNNNK